MIAERGERGEEKRRGKRENKKKKERGKKRKITWKKKKKKNKNGTGIFVLGRKKGLMKRMLFFIIDTSLLLRTYTGRPGHQELTICQVTSRPPGPSVFEAGALIADARSFSEQWCP